MKTVFSAVLPVVILALAPATYAGWPCSIEHAYPEVSQLSVEDGKLVAALGGSFRVSKAIVGSNGRKLNTYQYPRLEMSSDGSWVEKELGPKIDPDDALKTCMEVPSDAEAGGQSAYDDRPVSDEHTWFNQSVTTCATDGKFLWGGISFYAAEGGWGVGGLVRQDTETGAIEFIRPPRLKSRSVSQLAFFADSIWLGVNHVGECYGSPPGSGLKRLREYRSGSYGLVQVPEVCGFAIRDFQEFEGALWVATELGLSRLRADGEEWKNFIPDFDHPNLVREVTCDELYTELLESTAFAQIKGFDIGNAFDIFWERLSALRPNFTRRYMRKLHGHPVDDYPGKVYLNLDSRRVH